MGGKALGKALGSSYSYLFPALRVTWYFVPFFLALSSIHPPVHTAQRNIFQIPFSPVPYILFFKLSQFLSRSNEVRGSSSDFSYPYTPSWTMSIVSWRPNIKRSHFYTSPRFVA